MATAMWQSNVEPAVILLGERPDWMNIYYQMSCISQYGGRRRMGMLITTSRCRIYPNRPRPVSGITGFLDMCSIYPED